MKRSCVRSARNTSHTPKGCSVALRHHIRGGMKSCVQLHQHLLDAVGAFRLLMQAGFAPVKPVSPVPRTTPVHSDEEYDGLLHRHPVLLIIGFGLMFGGTGALIGGSIRSFRAITANLGLDIRVGLHRVPDRVRATAATIVSAPWPSAPTSRLTAFTCCDLAGGLPIIGR